MLASRVKESAEVSLLFMGVQNIGAV